MLTFPVWPMLPEEARPFSDPRFIFEIKWDGIRCLAHTGGSAHDRGVRLQSRNGADMTASFPELRELAFCLPPRTVIDGELVCLAPNGQPDFELVMRRFHARAPRTVERLARETPAALQVFDLLQLEGAELISLPLESRKEALLRLQGMGLPPAARITPWVGGEGERLFAEASRLGLEGIVGKRLDSPYEPGKRTLWWRKSKNYRTFTTTVLGFRRSPFTLLVGDPPDHVRAGLEHSVPQEVRAFITAHGHRFSRDMGQGTKRGAGPGTKGGVTWLEPLLHCEVRASGVTWAGRLREPVFVRLLRPDEPPEPQPG